MRKRILSLVLAVVMLISMMPMLTIEADAYSTSEIVEAALQLLYYNEGSYGSINKDDNGAVSVGKIQWHGNRALNLLKTIVDMDTSAAASILGTTLYDEIRTSSDWSTRTVSSAEATALSNLLTTANGKAAQDALATSDVTVYINHGKNLGITDAASLIYFADMENQGGYGMSSRVANAAASTAGSFGAITLSILHNAALADSVAGKYSTRRNNTYNYCLDYAVPQVDDHIDVSYRAYGLLEVTSDETWIKTLPCNRETDENSDNVEKAVPGDLYMAVRMVKNDVGNYWYKVTRLFETDEVIGYIYAGDVEFSADTDLVVSNLSVPAEIEVGSTLAIEGIVTSDHTKITQLNIWAKSHTDDSLVTLAALETNAVKVDLSSITLASLEEGTYTLYIGASAKSNYSPDGTTLSSATANPILHESTFAVVEEIICSHSYTSTVTPPTYTSQGYTTYTCTKCGYSYKSDYTDPLTRTFHLTFDPTGGTLPSAVATNTLDGINVAREAGYLVVYNNSGELVDSNQYGIEIQVDAAGKVIGRREYLSETDITVPTGGFILSGQGKNGTWVGEIALGYYVAYDEALMEVYVYDTHEAYVAYHKQVAENEAVGLLPVPTREGYTFDGWYTALVDGHKITEDEFVGSDLTLYAYWISDTCYDGHTLSGTVTTAPTVDSEGILHCVCTHCDYWQDIVMPAFNTTDYEYGVLTEPTCTLPGLGVYGWLNYDYGIYTFDVDIEPLGDAGHSYTATVVAPTCTEAGYTSYVCSACGDSYTDSATPATGHAYSMQSMLEPTETDTGNLIFRCENCSEDISVTLPVLSYLDYDFLLVQQPAVGQVGIGRYTWIDKTYGEIVIEVEYPALSDTLTIVEANELGVAQGAGNYTADSYYVTGVVTRVKNPMYGNLYIADENGVELYIHGMHDVDGNRYDYMNPCPIPGDTVTVYGAVGSYDGLTAQMLEVTMTECISATTESSDPEPGSYLSIPEAIALGESKPDNVFTTGSYYVTGIVSSVRNATYGNIDLVDQNGFTIYLYTVHDSTGTLLYGQMTDKPEVGDRITVYGRIGNYNGTAQIQHANVVERIPADELVTLCYHYNFHLLSPDFPEETQTETIEKGAAVQLVARASAFGYHFLGWDTSADAANAVYQCGDTVTLTGDLNLYAVWEKAPVITIPDNELSGASTAYYGNAWYEINCTVSGNYVFHAAAPESGAGVSIYLYDTDKVYLAGTESDGAAALEYFLDAGETYVVSVWISDETVESRASFDFSISKNDPVLYGDVNSDGKVNAKDRMDLTRYLAGMSGYTEDLIDMTAADVNADGKVNTQDRMILTRYLAQWTAYPTLPHLS